MLNSSERTNLYSSSRRRLLQTGLAITGALFIPAAIPTPVQAEEVVSTWAIRSNEEWFPYKRGIRAVSGRILTTLYDAEGPIDRYDKDFGTHAREKIEMFCRNGLEKSKAALAIAAKQRDDDSNSWGFCHAAAASNIELGRLVASGAMPPEQADKIFFDPNLYGLLVAYHAGDISDRPYDDQVEDQALYDSIRQQNNGHFINRLRDSLTPFVARIINGQLGAWYYVMDGYDGDKLIGKGFNGKIKVNSDQIYTSHEPISLSEARERRVREGLIDETSFMRFTSHNIGLTNGKIRAALGIAT